MLKVVTVVIVVGVVDVAVDVGLIIISLGIIAIC